MRLWHKDLIPFLPRQQLLGQWRECCLIAKNIAEKGTPNHLLVNRIMDYPFEHFRQYTVDVWFEMVCRHYKCDYSKFEKYIPKNIPVPTDDETFVQSLALAISQKDEIFKDWHDDRYMHQCLLNLQEKYDCGGISEEEYRILVDNTVIEDL